MLVLILILCQIHAWQPQSRIQQRTKRQSEANELSNTVDDSHRRTLLSTMIAVPSVVASFHDTNALAMEIAISTDPPNTSTSQNQLQRQPQKPFRSAGFDKKEYTNSIVASPDTNISPLEVYETLKQRLIMQQQRGSNSSNESILRALDVGAGAGVSTQVIYDMGYTEIDAVDWSGDAWQKNVIEEGYCPPSVHFYEMDDERFVQQQWKRRDPPTKYDIVAFNFAVNPDKATTFATSMLQPNGLLLAPINVQPDYWLKQTYQLLDAQGKVLWSANDVGAWSVQFQPDVTQDTCQGVWCPPFNGFQKLRR
jgi:2-polyprenyl-3-methyl-5-hydroxy-6-metoxy-1,4-benzoquinol methylase